MQDTLSLAPFQGLTDKYYRSLFLENFGGVDRVYAPFVSGIGTSQISKSKISDLLINDEPLQKTVPQIISNDSREIVLFGKTMVDYGYRHINWNLGCPFRRIASKAKGCGLLPYPGKLKKILDEIFDDNRLNFELSVKTRLGYHDKYELFEVIEIFNQYPLSEIIIHPRIGKQLYKGEIHLDEFEKCIDLSVHPVAYNGDIYNKTTFSERTARFNGVKHWMIGRGLLINPFLAEQIKNKTLSDTERRQRLHNFVMQLSDMVKSRICDERKTLDYIKAVTYYLSGSFKDSGFVFSKIKKLKTFEDFSNAFNEIINLPLSNDIEARDYFVSGLKHI